MAFNYRGPVNSGYTSVPLWVDDETGEEFLDFDGMLGAPPEMPDQRLASNEILGVPGYDPNAPIMFQGQDVSRPQPPPERPDTPPDMAGMMAPKPPSRSGYGVSAQPMAPEEEAKFMAEGGSPFAAREGVATADDLALPPREGLPGMGPPQIDRRYIPRDPGTPDRMVVDQIKSNSDPTMVNSMADRLDEIYGERARIQQDSALGRREEIVNEHDQLSAAIQQQRIEREEAEQDLIDQQEALAQKRQMVESRVSEMRERRVDPNRYWSDGGGGEKALGIIGIILGGIGQGLAGGPNQGLAMYNRMSDLDIRAQEQAIRNDRENADNMLADLRDELGSLDQAKDALKVMHLEQLKLEATQAALGKEHSQLGQVAQQVALDAEEAAIQNRLELQKKAGIEITQKRIEGRKARGGFYESPEAALKRQNAELSQLVKNRELYGKLSGEVVDKETQRQAEKYVKETQDIATMDVQLDQVESAYQQWSKANGGEPSALGVRSALIPEALKSAEQKMFENELDKASLMITKAISGAQATDQERERIYQTIKQGFFEGRDVGQQKLKSYRELGQRKMQRVRKAYPKGVEYLNRVNPEHDRTMDSPTDNARRVF